MSNKKRSQGASIPGKGKIQVDLGWKGLWHKLVFHGGPFSSVPYGMFAPGVVFGACVRQEGTIPEGPGLRLPIRDFDVPDHELYDTVCDALLQTIEAAMSGKLVYVGCMGGMGRTGLFLALIAKALGVSDPVPFVRRQYYSHAVETGKQYTYVTNFDVGPVRRKLFWAALRHRMS